MAEDTPVVDVVDDDSDTRPQAIDAAAAVKSRRVRRPQAVIGQEDDIEQEPESSSHPLELAAHRPSAPHTLTGSWVAGHVTSADYTVAKDHAYLTWYPEGCQQPSTRLLWTRGQHVLREYYDRFGGDEAPSTPETAMPVNEPGGGLLDEGRGMQSLHAGV
jgi:hypothetical protein